MKTISNLFLILAVLLSDVTLPLFSAVKFLTETLSGYSEVSPFVVDHPAMSHYMLYGQRRKQSLHLIPVKMLFRAVNMTEQEKHIL